MWNILQGSLLLGATPVLYDGSPGYPDMEVLWQLAAQSEMTVFGTSAAYLMSCMNQDMEPGRRYNLSSLKAIGSTGSPLSAEGFGWVYDRVKEDILLGSVSGGTDPCTAFLGCNPLLPVRAGELQCRCLAMKVEAYDEMGNPVINQQGELVCTAPSPSMPIYFWNDQDGSKYHAAYFDVYPNIWRHGDFIMVNDRGGVVIYGRSDATLNPGGVRIGTAEIYRQMEQMDEIEDSLVVGQNWKNDVRVILFVQMAAGAELTDDLKSKIKTTIRTNASPRHVPAKILKVPEVPYTLNMKKVELAVKKVIQGQEVLNKDALRNPEILDFYANIKELHED